MYREIDHIVIERINENIEIDSLLEDIDSIRYSRWRKGYVVKCDNHELFVPESKIQSIVIKYKEDY